MELTDKSASSSSSSSSPIKRFCRKYLSPARPSGSTSSPPSSPTLSRINDEGGCSTDMERVFKYFDENGDGKISPAELQRCVRTAGGEMSEEEAEMAVRTSDADGDGLLGLEDFTKLMECCGEEEKRDDLKGAFEMYAVKGSGHITHKSLKKMLTRLGDKTISTESCKAMIRRFDMNGDGVLSFDEFKIMMR